MKKVFLLMSMAATMFAFAGCQKNEQEAPVNPNEGGSTFEFVAEIAQTKTTLDVENGYKVDWEEGDLIYMVTSDGTWGKPYEQDKTTESIAEFTYSSGKFTTAATIQSGEYIFNAVYSNGEQMSYHRSDKTTNLLNATQTQDCANPTAHIKANDALVGTFTATVPMTEMAKMKMSHLYTLMQVNVKNATGAAVNVTKFEMTAEGADLAGIFNVTSFETPSITAKEGEAATETITVNVTGEAVDDANALPIYFVMAPLTNYSGNVTFKVTDSEGKTYTKTVTMNGISFEAGKYNTTPYTIKEADQVVAPDQPGEGAPYYEKVTSAPADWSGKYLIVYEGDSGAYVFNGLDAVNGYVDATISNNKIDSTTDLDAVAVSIDVMQGGYSIKTANGYIYGVSGSNALKFHESTPQLNTIEYTADNGIVVTSNTSILRFNKASNQLRFRYYKSGQESIVLYKYVAAGGGETPEPESKTLVSIAVAGQTTSYTVGDTFNFDGTVTATYSNGSTMTVTPTNVSQPNMTTVGTKVITVSYTEGEKTVITTYEIEVVEPQDLPMGIENIKAKATSTSDAAFKVVLTDAIVTYVSGSNAYIEDAEAGIFVYNSSHGLKSGDKLNGEVSGKVKLYNSLREVTAIDYSNATKTTGAEIPVTVLTLAELNADGAYDKYENMRIKIENATVSAAKQISQNGQTYALYFKNTSVTGFDIDNTIDVIGYPSKYNADIQFNVWENAVVKKASKTTITGVSDLTVAVGASKVINASASSGEKVTYVSADPTIATVDKTGNVTGVAEGETTITVSVPANDVYPAAEQTCKVTVTAGEVAKVWTLVTDASTLKAGDQIVIVATNSNYAMSSTQNSNNRAQAAVIKSGNTISEPGTSVQKLILEAGKTAGTFAFNTGSGYLYAASSSKNYLRTETTLSANSSWNITITTAGVATIKATGSNTRNWIRYNSSNNPPIFSCYGSGQADISIYRYE